MAHGQAAIEAKIKEVQDRFDVPEALRCNNEDVQKNFWAREFWFAHDKLSEYWENTSHGSDAHRGGIATKSGPNPLLTAPGEKLHITDVAAAKKQQAAKIKRAKGLLKNAVTTVTKGHLLLMKKPNHKDDKGFMTSYVQLETWVGKWSERLEADEEDP